MKKIKTIITCILLLVFSYIVFTIIVRSAPKAESKRPIRQALLVNSFLSEINSEVVKLELAGTVIPDQEISLKSRINGEVIEISDEFIRGGIIKKGGIILSIDPTDYELILTNALSKLETAKFNYNIELGRQKIAKKEWALLRAIDATDKEEFLALRKPHLESVKANLQAAKATVRAAKLDLERTKIYAPFDALIKNDYVDIGSQITTLTPLGDLVGIERFFVEVSVPIDRLKWINIPGSSVKIKSNTKDVFIGEVIRLSGSLETSGRMAKIIVAINNPWKNPNITSRPLLLGEYVNVCITGKLLDDVTRIPRKSLRENNWVWIDDGGKLKIQPVDILFKETDFVLVRGIPSQSLIITSDIAAPVPNRLIISSEN
ncbi:MAG: efflux RND transporter periplasmic adaptor subunit [Pontiellaceae bacterium]